MIRAEVKKVYSKTLKYLNQVSMEADLIRMHKHSERIQYLLDQQERRKNELSD